jgi:hypothetical protein
MGFSAADFMEDQTLALQRIAHDISMQAGFNLGADDWQAGFYMPGEVEVDFGVRARGHEVDVKRSPLKRARGSNSWSLPSRKTAGLETLRESSVNAATTN